MTETHVEVTCGGSTHRILVTRRGAVALLDHPDLRTEEALVALADGQLPLCVHLRQQFADWRGARPGERVGLTYTAPHRRAWFIARGRALEQLAGPLQKADRRRGERRQWADRQPGQAVDLCAPTARRRRERRLEEEAHHALHQCSYRYPFISGPAGGLNATVGVDRDCFYPTIVGGLGEGGMMGGLWGCGVSVELGLSWVRVWRRGLAVIDRKFVLEIVEDGDPLIVRAGRQRRDFTVESCFARVTRSGRLRWLDMTDDRYETDD